MWTKVAKINGNTDDIISALCMAVPGAIEQVKQYNLVDIIGLQGANLVDDAIRTGMWIRANVKYKIDDFGHQNIQYPSSVLRSGLADCKSLSLLYLSIMESGGWNGGFRFASYKEKKPFTHVYNFFLDNSGTFYTFDACIKDLKEIKKYKKKKDMQVNYIAGVPTMIENNPQGLQYRRRSRYYIGEEGIGRKKGKGKGKGKIGKFIKKGFQTFKTVALSPARAPFIGLVSINFRGLARKLNEARKKNPAKYQEWWLKIGGDIDKLNKAVDKAKDKKPFLGEKKGVRGIDNEVFIGYIGAEPVSTATLLTAAAGIIASASKLFQQLGIKNAEGEVNVDEGVEGAKISEELEPGENFAANDPASKEAEDYATSGGVVKPNIKPSTKGGASFKPSPLLIGAGVGTLALIFLLTKKK